MDDVDIYGNIESVIATTEAEPKTPNVEDEADLIYQDQYLKASNQEIFQPSTPPPAPSPLPPSSSSSNPSSSTLPTSAPPTGFAIPSSSHADYAQDGQFMKVESGDEKCLYLTNLHWWSSDRNLEDLCQPFGRVKKVRFLEEKTNGKSKGSAFVQFWNPEDSNKAVAALTGTKLENQDLVVSLATTSQFDAMSTHNKGKKERLYNGAPNPQRGGFGNNRGNQPYNPAAYARGGYGRANPTPPQNAPPPMAMPPQAAYPYPYPAPGTAVNPAFYPNYAPPMMPYPYQMPAPAPSSSSSSSDKRRHDDHDRDRERDRDRGRDRDKDSGRDSGRDRDRDRERDRDRDRERDRERRRSRSRSRERKPASSSSSSRR